MMLDQFFISEKNYKINIGIRKYNSRKGTHLKLQLTQLIKELLTLSIGALN